MIRILAAIILLASCPSFATSVVAQDWPTWMGPNLDGVSNEKGWSPDWPESGLEELWTTEIGIGFSSVSIVDNLLYTMGHNDGHETVWCLNATNGEIVWQHRYPAELNPNLYEGGPGSTPTVDSDSVYTLSIDGRLICLNRITGAVIWEKQLQDELDVDMHEWGFNASPLIINDQLILEAGRVVSIDKNTGEKLWQSKRHRAGYGSVRSFRHKERLLLASLESDGLRISDAEDGVEVAFAEWKSPFRTNGTTPIIVDDRIYISTGYNVGCGLFRFTGSDLEEIYTSKRMRNHFNNSILFKGHLYGFDGNSNLGRVVTLTCMNFETGKVHWKQRGLGCGSLMIADGKLLILSEKGDLVVSNATAEGFKELNRSEFLTGRCWTVPVLLNGRVYGRNAAGTLTCRALPASK